MRRTLILAMLLATLAFPTAVLGFHHVVLPATECHAAAAGSPSNDNGQAKENLFRLGLIPPPLAPVDVPGEGPTHNVAGDNCANAED